MFLNTLERMETVGLLIWSSYSFLAALRKNNMNTFEGLMIQADPSHRNPARLAICTQRASGRTPSEVEGWRSDAAAALTP